MAETFRLALAQAPADLGDAQDRLAWLAQELPQVAAKGADLLILPELFACGYNIGGAVITRAEAVDGPTARAMAGLARTHGIAIHYGFAERADDRIFNAVLCVGPLGDVLVHQRKLAIPPGPERRYFCAGQGCRLFEFRGLNIATLICYDAEFPETVRHVAALGADLVLVPTALSAEWANVADQLIPTRAFENGVYLAYANSAGHQNDMQFLGRSAIVAPNGSDAARADHDPTFLFADINRGRVTAAQERLPYLQDRLSFRMDI